MKRHETGCRCSGAAFRTCNAGRTAAQTSFLISGMGKAELEKGMKGYKGFCRRQTGKREPYQTMPSDTAPSRTRCASVHIIPNHELIVYHQVIVAVQTTPVFLAEAGFHTLVFVRLAPE